MPDSPRRALLLACSAFADSSLPPLRSPETDVSALTDALADPNGSRYEVSSNTNSTSYEARIAIESFFTNARPRDRHLIYFSGHGVLDARGELYFAFSDTRRSLLDSTAVSAAWIRSQVRASRAKTTIILIDCCFSGSFLLGMQARSDSDANVATLVRGLPEGSGVAVLTASGESEFSLEADERSEAIVRPSYFTEAVVSGIATGAADLDGDGRITVDELYSYVAQRIRESPSPQRPLKLDSGEGHIVVATVALLASGPIDSRPSKTSKAPSETAEHYPILSEPVTVEGPLGRISFDGRWVTVTKDGHGPRMKGSKRLHISQITAVVVRPANRLYHGYIQLHVRGQSTAPVTMFGLAAGRPHREDPYSMSFSHKRNDAVANLKHLLEDALS
jgi:hypothetical protein